MATHHAQPGELVDLTSWADDIPSEGSKAITKIDRLELARLVVPADTEMHRSKYCRVSGPIVVHCLDGEIELKTRDAVTTIKAGQLVYLLADTDHAIRGILDSVVLLTIVLTT
ncbi:MAG: hypothetical protein IPG25_15590 [Proteobacteria bacterium]|nr:hypothetical protein [Pseudomonadota bacterium]